MYALYYNVKIMEMNSDCFLGPDLVKSALGHNSWHKCRPKNFLAWNDRTVISTSDCVSVHWAW